MAYNAALKGRSSTLNGRASSCSNLITVPQMLWQATRWP
jgi:hypothetical protein